MNLFDTFTIKDIVSHIMHYVDEAYIHPILDKSDIITFRTFYNENVSSKIKNIHIVLHFKTTDKRNKSKYFYHESPLLISFSKENVDNSCYTCFVYPFLNMNINDEHVYAKLSMGENLFNRFKDLDPKDEKALIIWINYPKECYGIQCQKDSFLICITAY